MKDESPHRDFVNAADNFRQGFEALPEGPKAADNLLKMADANRLLNQQMQDPQTREIGKGLVNIGEFQGH